MVDLLTSSRHKSLEERSSDCDQVVSDVVIITCGWSPRLACAAATEPELNFPEVLLECGDELQVSLGVEEVSALRHANPWIGPDFTRQAELLAAFAIELPSQTRRLERFLTHVIQSISSAE